MHKRMPVARGESSSKEDLIRGILRVIDAIIVIQFLTLL